MSVDGGEWAWLSPLSLLNFYMSWLLILKAFYTRTYHNIWAGSANWSYFMWLGFLFILNRLFVCLFVCTFLHFFFGYFFKCATIQIWDQTCQKLLPAVEVTSKHGWRDNKPISSCHIMFIIVYSSFIFELWIFVFIEFMYWIYVFIFWIYWRAREASETLSGLFNWESRILS